MRLYKYVTFLFLLYAIGVCLFNLSGYDDKNILLYFSNPLGWQWPIKNNFLALMFNSNWLRTAIIYVYMVFFWGVSGLILDIIFHASKRKILLKWLMSIVIVACFVVVAANLYYKNKSSEAGILQILKFSEQYSSETMQTAIYIALEDGYALKYINELSTIIKTTDDINVYTSAMYSLATFATPEAINIMIDTEANTTELIPYLQHNSNTIVQMLELNQTPDTLEAGIKATTIYRINRFKNPLINIVNEHTDEHIVEQAMKALEYIEQNPFR